MNESLHCPLLLAIELGEGEPPASLTLATEAAAGLVDRVAVDLARLLPGVESLGLIVCGALLDPAQVLRPSWPVFAELALQYDRHARGKGEAQLVGLGAAGGRMTSPQLEPESGLGAGALLVIPLLLIGDATAASAAGQRLESVLEAEGLAGADTVWYLSRALSTKIEHARYLTHHDLCALTQIQLEHAGFAAAWQLIEAALLTPESAELAISASGVPLRWQAGELSMVVNSYAGFAGHLSRHGGTRDELLAGFVAIKREERMLAALFQAHGLPVRMYLVANGLAGSDAFDGAKHFSEAHFIESLALPTEGSEVQVFVHEHPELGTVALTAVEFGAAGIRELAHAYPQGRSGLRELRNELRKRYPWSGPEVRLGTIGLSDDQRNLSTLAFAGPAIRQ